MNDIYSGDLLHSLPLVLKNDPEALVLARVVADQLKKTTELIKLNRIYTRIDELDEALLDILAYDMAVDWYDYSYPVEVKRATLKDSIAVHRKLGTKYAVETALGAVFPGTTVEEWFEYGGDPFTFRVIIGATGEGVSIDRQEAVLERVRFYKNLRSHLETISYKYYQDTRINVAGHHAVGTRLEIYPYFTKEIEAAGGLWYGVFSHITKRLEILPFLPTELETSGVLIYASFLHYTNRVEINPMK